MSKIIINLFCTMAILVCGTIWMQRTQADDNMKAFPKPEKGQVRFVLQLPEQKTEADFRVELMIGKTVEVDEVNHYFFGGKVEEETIEGWGFPRYVLKELGPMAGTLIGVDPSKPKVKRFVTLGGEPMLLRYNSRLPLVIYAPDGVEVQYRIWKAEPEVKPIDKG